MASAFEAEEWRERLRRLVEQKGMTMKSLSIAAGLGETFIRDVIERGRMPGIDNFAAIAETIGVSLEHLWYGRANDGQRP